MLTPHLIEKKNMKNNNIKKIMKWGNETKIENFANIIAL